MILIRNLVLWLARHMLALLLILLILIVGRYALPPALDWLAAQSVEARDVPRQQATLAEVQQRFAAWSAQRRAQAERETLALAQAPVPALQARRTRIGEIVSARERERLGTAQLALAAAGGDTQRVLGHYRAGAEIALLGRERDYIDALLNARAADGQGQDLRSRRARAVAVMQASRERWEAASARVEALERRPLAQARNLLCRTARPGVGCNNYRALVQARSERDRAAADHRRARATILAADRISAGVAASRAAAADASAAFEAQRRELASRVEQVERTAADNWLLWIRRPVMETLPTALAILAGVIFAPLLIKALLYFAVAPAAARRPPIRLVPDENGAVKAAGKSSAPSQSVPLGPGFELLVVPEALQSSPHLADKATQWLLNWSMPLSSLASGLVALVRLRARDPDFALVSATGSPIAEVALVELERGSALTLRPRALRGLVQPIREPVRITRHWRIGHLSAWLTLQLRYLVFHGPCTLIVEGTRGVRLEPAARGRGINQAATLGFSAGLAYGVRRTEAFGAYLIGKQELFNDSFDSENGVCLYEEMPREGEKGGLWGRGLRGLGDAALKVFGV